MSTVENSIRDFMNLRDIDLFWIDSHMNVIRQGLAQNNFFATHIVEHKLKRRGYTVQEYNAVIGVRYPDKGTSGLIRLRYTFDPDRKKAHKLWIESHPPANDNA